MKSEIKTCFIAASFQTNLTTVKEVLLERNIKPIILSEMAIRGLSITEQLSKAIKNSDLIIAILRRNESNPNIFLELGMAYALNKRAIIIAPSSQDLPSDLMGALYLNSDANNREAIALAIDTLISAPKRKSQSEVPLPERLKSQPIGNTAFDLLNRLRALGNNATERQLSDLIIEALKASGVSVYAQSGPTEIGADIAIWADDLHPTFGNPFLIEIKKSINRSKQVEKLSYQFLKYLHKGKSNWILALYLNGNRNMINDLIYQHPGILVTSISELFQRLSKESFATIVKSLRNQKTHNRVI